MLLLFVQSLICSRQCLLPLPLQIPSLRELLFIPPPSLPLFPSMSCSLVVGELFILREGIRKLLKVALNLLSKSGCPWTCVPPALAFWEAGLTGTQHQARYLGFSIKSFTEQLNYKDCPISVKKYKVYYVSRPINFYFDSGSSFCCLFLPLNQF